MDIVVEGEPTAWEARTERCEPAFWKTLKGLVVGSRRLFFASIEGSPVIAPSGRFPEMLFCWALVTGSPTVPGACFLQEKPHHSMGFFAAGQRRSVLLREP